MTAIANRSGTNGKASKGLSIDSSIWSSKEISIFLSQEMKELEGLMGFMGIYLERRASFKIVIKRYLEE